jgi:hypothetical protein
MIPMLVVCNTSDDDLERNIRYNSENHKNWLNVKDSHKGVAVMIGGGASIANHVDDIASLVSMGATVFAMNAASKWAREHGIEVDYQVIADAKFETSTLVDPLAKHHLFASQCNPETFSAVSDATLWHLETGEVERFFPVDRVKKGGYVLIGGGASVGNSAMCVAYSQGFREFHIFGYDSCHHDGKSHAYEQQMNKLIPTTIVRWAGRSFIASVAMKAQAEKFQMTSQALKQSGCDLHVYGDGLLQTMYHAKSRDLTEQQKYQTMWQFDTYRDVSPGENVAELFLQLVNPHGLIIDFGCGTGRASVQFSKKGHDVFLIDFTDNCRDDEALSLPFMQWDLLEPCPARAPYGFCTDVMEHIAPENVDTVIRNIMEAADTTFFQISTIPDKCGAMIDHQLHLTVKPHSWWKDTFIEMGYNVQWEQEQDIASMFIVKRNTH